MNSALSGRTQLRSSGFYVRFDEDWYESAHAFQDAYPTDFSLRLYSAATGKEFRVPSGEVETMERVTARVKYRGRWFGLGSFWSTPLGPDWRDPEYVSIGGSTRSGVDWMREMERTRIRGWVAAGSPDCFAYVEYVGPDGREVVKLPGAKFRDQWPPSYNEVMLTIPVSEIEDYAEEVSVIPPRES